MDEYDYPEAVFLQTNFLNQELMYLDKEITYEKECGDTKEYATLMRLYLNAQDRFLKLIAIMETENAKVDDLTEFAASCTDFNTKAPNVEKEAI